VAACRYGLLGLFDSLETSNRISFTRKDDFIFLKRILGMDELDFQDALP